MKAIRVAQATFGALLVLALTACGSGDPSVMPDVTGTQLDVAKSDIERAGFGGDVEIVGGGLFGVVDDTNWLVCEQEPAAGEAIAKPRLVVDREGGTAEEPSEPSAEPVEPVAPPVSTAPPVVEVHATETMVDELLDRLNSADMGGMQTGDHFRFTGELVMSQMWYTGATGDFVVLFKAHGGADDLMVLVHESDAAGWTDGTRLTMTVVNVAIELDGEATDGWLRMVSATPAG